MAAAFFGLMPRLKRCHAMNCCFGNINTRRFERTFMLLHISVMKLTSMLLCPLVRLNLSFVVSDFIIAACLSGSDPLSFSEIAFVLLFANPLSYPEKVTIPGITKIGQNVLYSFLYTERGEVGI